ANSYPLIIIFSMMWLSFTSGRSPANNMTLFMFSLLFVSVTWLYTIRAAAMTSIITYIGACIGIYYFLDTKEAIVMNMVAGLMLISGFYFISRMLYSYHANYFIQLKHIERNNHEINKIGQLKTEMLGIVAHDLRSPINSISALVELARNMNATQNEREQYSDMIIEACDEARNIIRDLILIVKGESSQGLQLQDINVNLFLSKVQQHWSHQMKDGKQILLTVPENIITARLDEDKMLRVLDNFISNAIKFTNDGAKIHLQLSPKGKEYTCITVSDNGIGIPENMQPFLFDRFSKAGRLGLKGEKSHGLGLNICKQIIEQHGGNIRLESRENEGTHFHITIPLDASKTTSVLDMYEEEGIEN
ncbi:MAG: HAMP domain-containing histidine kinase, partial [Chitinophagaceae bacterium]|nr:HAMP domain-containing histidine kinase [Chitinophagaceae bacterium]